MEIQPTSSPGNNLRLRQACDAARSREPKLRRRLPCPALERTGERSLFGVTEEKRDFGDGQRVLAEESLGVVGARLFDQLPNLGAVKPALLSRILIVGYTVV